METPQNYWNTPPPRLTFIRWESEDPRIIFDTLVEPYIAPPSAENHTTHWNVTLYSEYDCTGDSRVVSSSLYEKMQSSTAKDSEAIFAIQPISWISNVKSWAVSWTPTEAFQITPRVLVYREYSGVAWAPRGNPEITGIEGAVLISDTTTTTQDVTPGNWYIIKGNLDPSVDMTPCSQYYTWTFSILAGEEPTERSFAPQVPVR
jgi:hypothetical protein